MLKDCKGLRAGIAADAPAPLPSIALTEYNTNTSACALAPALLALCFYVVGSVNEPSRPSRPYGHVP